MEPYCGAFESQPVEKNVARVDALRFQVLSSISAQRRPTPQAGRCVPDLFCGDTRRAYPGLVTRILASWNQLGGSLRQITGLRLVA